MVDPFQQAIGQARFDEADDACPVGLDRLGELHERLDASTLDFLGPSREMGASRRGVDPGYLTMQVAGVLKEAQMLPCAFDRVVNRAGLPFGISKPAATCKADGQVKLLATVRARFEFNGVHLPRGLQAKRHAKQLFAVHDRRFQVGLVFRGIYLASTLPGTGLPTRFHIEPLYISSCDNMSSRLASLRDQAGIEPPFKI